MNKNDRIEAEFNAIIIELIRRDQPDIVQRLVGVHAKIFGNFSTENCTEVLDGIKVWLVKGANFRAAAILRDLQKAINEPDPLPEDGK